MIGYEQVQVVGSPDVTYIAMDPLDLPWQFTVTYWRGNGRTYTHFICERCNVVVPIRYESAAEVAKHADHPCRYTELKS